MSYEADVLNERYIERAGWNAVNGWLATVQQDAWIAYNAARQEEAMWRMFVAAMAAEPKAGETVHGF